MSDIDLGEVRVTIFSVMGITVSAVVPVKITDNHVHLAFSGQFETGEQFLSYKQAAGFKKFLVPYVENASVGTDHHGDYVELKARSVAPVRFRVYTEIAVEVANSINTRIRGAARSPQAPVVHKRPRSSYSKKSPHYARPKYSKVSKDRRKTKPEGSRIPAWVLVVIAVIILGLALKYTFGL